MLIANNSKNKFNGKRLKSARKYREKSMSDLSKDIGVSRQTISQYEHGLISPQFEILMKIVNSLNFPKEYFYENNGIDIGLGNTYFRASSRMSKKEENAQKEKTKIIGRIFSFLNEYIEFPELNIPNFEEEMEIEDMANKLREYWGLGSDPIKDIIYVLEKNGIIITSMNTRSKNIDAFSQQQDINGIKHFLIVLGNDKNSAVRRQFSVAHELGHIIMHDAFLDIEDLTKDELRSMEQDAHKFAAAFLLPKEKFIEDVSIYPTDLNYYKELKKKWRTSISAMLVRANQLEVITNSSYQTLMKKMSKLGWRMKEPLDDTLIVKEPTILKRAIDIILDNDILDEDEIIENLSKTGLTLNREEIELLLGLDEGKLKSKKNNNNVIKMALKNR